MAVFNDFAPPCMYSMCDRLGWTSLGKILIHTYTYTSFSCFQWSMGRPLTPLAGSTSQERSDAWSNVARRGRAPSLSANPFFVQLFVEANVFQLIKLRTNLCELAGNVGLGGPFACGHRFSRAQRRCPTYYDLARLYNTVPEKATCMIASAGERSMRIY